MKERIERHVEQRTAMLAGVSHDLRTILTRFRLELAFLGDSTKVKALKEDVEEMQTMLEAYMAFVRGDGGEKAEACNIAEMVAGAAKTGTRPHSKLEIDVPEDLVAKVKPNAFRRLIVNLIANAARYGEAVAVWRRPAQSPAHHGDDNGPGIPADMREDVFRPFVRLDESRNQDEGGHRPGSCHCARYRARAWRRHHARGKPAWWLARGGRDPRLDAFALDHHLAVEGKDHLAVLVETLAVFGGQSPARP